MKRSAMLIFECVDFVITPGEDSETNPGVYGKSLARWLAGQLHAAGFPAGAVFAEDFGWCIPVGAKPHAVHVVCAGNGDVPDQWCVFVFTESGFMARLLGNDKSAASLAEVFGAVAAVSNRHRACAGFARKLSRARLRTLHSQATLPSTHGWLDPQGWRAAILAWASSASRSDRSRTRPARITAWMRAMLVMSVSGLASSSTRSAVRPGSTEPNFPSRPK